jgi:tripartite-type tricarboxylate transporter receptor subunit TctC
MLRASALPAATAAALIVISAPAAAQVFPAKPVRWVVPYAPGGNTDMIARVLGAKMTESMGQTVVVENRAGAATLIGAEFVARAPADGYTILLGGAATHAFAPWVYKQLRYDPARDFVAVTQFTEGPLALCVNAASGAATLADFVKTMKTGSAVLNYASNGNGTFPHLSVEMMNQALGAKPQHVPFPGGAQAVTALMAGQVQFTQNHIPVVQAHVKSGRLRVLATTGSTRSPSFPDVPTLKESGLDVVASAWFGLFVPAGTPPAVVERIHQATAAAAKVPALREKIAAQGDEVKVEGPARFQAFQAAELEKWRQVITSTGLKLD